MAFERGTTFPNFASFEKHFKKYRDVSKCEYWKRDSRSVAAFNRGKGPDKQIDPKLVYGEILFCCIHGGEKYRYRGDGQRHSSTLRKQCPAHVRLRATTDGQYLRISSLSEEHNHELTQVRSRVKVLKNRAISERTRYKKVLEVTSRLTELASESDDLCFLQRLEALEKMLELWEDDRVVGVFDIVEALGGQSLKKKRRKSKSSKHKKKAKKDHSPSPVEATICQAQTQQQTSASAACAGPDNSMPGQCNAEETLCLNNGEGNMLRPLT